MGTFNSEKPLFSSTGKITNTALETTVKCSLYCSRTDELKFCFKLCARSARFYALVRDRSAFLSLSMSSLKCLLCCSINCRYAGTTIFSKIEVVYVLLLCSSALGLYPVCASNRRHHQSAVGGPSNSGRQLQSPPTFKTLHSDWFVRCISSYVLVYQPIKSSLFFD